MTPGEEMVINETLKHVFEDVDCMIKIFFRMDVNDTKFYYKFLFISYIFWQVL
jgi:hypothetical protein